MIEPEIAFADLSDNAALGARSSAAISARSRLEVLDASMAERGIDREHYAWYRDLRR